MPAPAPTAKTAAPAPSTASPESAPGPTLAPELNSAGVWHFVPHNVCGTPAFLSSGSYCVHTPKYQLSFRSGVHLPKARSQGCSGVFALPPYAPSIPCVIGRFSWVCVGVGVLYIGICHAYQLTNEQTLVAGIRNVCGCVCVFVLLCSGGTSDARRRLEPILPK